MPQRLLSGAQVYVSAATTLKIYSNNFYNEGRYVANFTGMWLARLLTPPSRTENPR
jgi:hypothetical protein